jgi:predicted MPP superfamily phosphohydrolase
METPTDNTDANRSQTSRSRKTTRRQVIRATLGAAALVGLYTWRIEPHWIEIVRRTLPIDHLPSKLQGSTLVQLSDLHIGPQVDDAYVIHAMELVRELNPDIVIYTGDFVSYHSDLDGNVAKILPKLALGRLGTIGVLGNHDYGRGFQDHAFADRVVAMANDAGVMILRNEFASIEGLNIVGVDEVWSNRCRPQDVLPSLATDQPALVLLHNPDGADLPLWEPFQGWILSGHTHGGQCKPPFLPPPIVPVRNRRYTSGEIPLSNGRRMYINRGLGHLMRVRFNARPEITMFTLVSKS